MEEIRIEGMDGGGMMKTGWGGHPPKRENPHRGQIGRALGESTFDAADKYDYSTPVYKVDEIIRKRVRLYRAHLWLDYMYSVLED
jgi:hypothetical protein